MHVNRATENIIRTRCTQMPWCVRMKCVSEGSFQCHYRFKGSFQCHVCFVSAAWPVMCVQRRHRAGSRQWIVAAGVLHAAATASDAHKHTIGVNRMTTTQSKTAATDIPKTRTPHLARSASTAACPPVTGLSFTAAQSAIFWMYS